MIPCVRVLRFARPTPRSTGDETLAQIWLDEPGFVVGSIRRERGRWVHVLNDGVPSGLASRHSRSDLESQIILYHLGSLPGTDTATFATDAHFAVAS